MVGRIGRVEVFIQDIIDIFGEPDRGEYAGKGAPYKDIEWEIPRSAHLGKMRLYTYKEKEYVSDQAVHKLHVGGTMGHSQMSALEAFLYDMGVEYTIFWD